jgi:hypothetical protein
MITIKILLERFITVRAVINFCETIYRNVQNHCLVHIYNIYDIFIYLDFKVDLGKLRFVNLKVD